MNNKLTVQITTNHRPSCVRFQEMTDTDKCKVKAINQDINNVFSANSCAACIATFAALFATTSAICLDKINKLAWMIVLVTIVVSWWITQRRPRKVAADNDLRCAHFFTAVAVLFVMNNVGNTVSHAIPFGDAHRISVLAVLITGLFSLSLVPNTRTRHRALVCLLRIMLLMGLLTTCIAAGTENFADYRKQKGKIITILDKFGIGLLFYWLQLSLFEFVWKTTTILAVFMPLLIWTSDGVNELHVDVAFQAVVHSISLLAFAAVSDRRYRMFSLEWMYTVATENVTGIVVTVMCLALYCRLTSQMMLFALFWATALSIALIARKHGQRQVSAQPTATHGGIQSYEATEEALAIQRFQLSYKPFVAFSVVCMVRCVP